MSRRNLTAVAQMIGLPEDYIVTKYVKGDTCDRAWVEKREITDRTCPECGAKGHINGHARSRVWHLPVRGGTQLCLLLHQVRLRCPACHKCWSESHENLLSSESIHMSKDVATAILYDLRQRKSVKECADTWGPSRHLVNKVIESVFVEWQYMPETLCIDEFKADTDAGKMAIGIYDGAAGALIEVLPDMKRTTLDWFFERFTQAQRQNVRFFCCDMSSEMIAVWQRWFAHAKLCIDRFHVIKLANEALSRIRRRIQDDASIDEGLRRELKGSWKLLVMGRAKLYAIDDAYANKLAEKRATIQQTLALTEDELNALPGMCAREPRAKKLERLLGQSEELKVAYALAHDLRVIHRTGKAAWWDGMEGELIRWCSLAQQSKIPEMVVCAKTLKRNRVGILNSYRYDRTNAVAEGINNSIKVCKRRGYGIRRFQALRRRLLLALGVRFITINKLTIRDITEE